MRDYGRREFVAVSAVGLIGVASGALAAPVARTDTRLRRIIDTANRRPEDRARDAFRHPYESLLFWGLKPGATVVEISPGSGWWTDILGPYLAETRGRYIAADADLDDPKTSDGARKARAAFEAKYGTDRKAYGEVRVTGFGQHSGPLAPPASVDLIIVPREVHNWAQVDGLTQKAFDDFRAALKPGGFVGVEDHRAPDGADPKKNDGYISEAWVIAQARQAGLQLDARSDINANPKDTKDHPFGVWTLPPSRRSSPFGAPADPAFDHAKYDAIGESDRMTLRFVKPRSGRA